MQKVLEFRIQEWLLRKIWLPICLVYMKIDILQKKDFTKIMLDKMWSKTPDAKCKMDRH